MKNKWININKEPRKEFGSQKEQNKAFIITLLYFITLRVGGINK